MSQGTIRYRSFYVAVLLAGLGTLSGIYPHALAQEQENTRSKPGQSKPGQSKPGQSKPGQSKPGQSKPGQSATVEIITAQGESMQASLLSIDKQVVRIDINGKKLQLPLDDLAQVRFVSKPVTGPVGRVQLSGGSVLAVTSIEMAGDQITFRPGRQDKLKLPVKQIRSIRYRPANAATDAAWLGMLEEPSRSDRLAVRRDDRSIEPVNGTVVSISRDAVQFDLGGNMIDAPLAKLEGVIFSKNDADNSPATIRVRDHTGSVWMARDMVFADSDGSVTIELDDSIRHSIPLNQIMEVEFAGGILSLADVEVASSDYRANASLSLQADRLSTWFGPRVTAESIEVQVPGKIRFRVPDGFQKLVVAARRSPDANEFVAVKLRVLLDGNVAWESELDDRNSKGLELPLGDARQFTLEATSPDSDETVPVSTKDLSNDQPIPLGGSVQWFGGRLLK